MLKTSRCAGFSGVIRYNGTSSRAVWIPPAATVIELRDDVRSQSESENAVVERVWSFEMAQSCDLCGKGPQFGNNISHAHNVSRRRWNVNLRPVKALVKGQTKRMRVCSSCIRAGKVTKAGATRAPRIAKSAAKKAS
jgi:large subunit ribosomal protein L28